MCRILKKYYYARKNEYKELPELLKTHIVIQNVYSLIISMWFVVKTPLIGEYFKITSFHLDAATLIPITSLFVLFIQKTSIKIAINSKLSFLYFVSIISGFVYAFLISLYFFDKQLMLLGISVLVIIDTAPTAALLLLMNSYINSLHASINICRVGASTLGIDDVRLAICQQSSL